MAKNYTKSKSFQNSKQAKSRRTQNSKGYKQKNAGNDSEDTYEKTTGSNDPSWYSSDSALLRDAASIPFSWAIGTNIPTHHGEYTIPGIMTLALTPTCGTASSPNDPINVAATSMYSFVRHANSGHSNYDAPDLMLYVLAMSQVYSYINFCMRIYGLATLYAQRNRYLPRVAVEANGVNFDDVIGNLANFRYGINVLINKAASLAVPAEMTIFQRHAFLYSNVYTEGTSIKDQLYMYVPSGFLRYKETTLSGGTLELQSWCDYSSNASRRTVASILNFGNQLLDPILQSEDMNIMSGDILKAYGGNILRLAALPTEFPIVPVFDLGVLEQFRNATIFPSATSFSIYQYHDTDKAISYLKTSIPDSIGYLGSSKCLAPCMYNLSGSMVLTVESSDPSPELVIESTRLKFTARDIVASTESGSATLYGMAFGSEIATACYVWYYTGSASSGFTTGCEKFGTFVLLDQNGISGMEASKIWDITNFSQFKYAPLTPCYAVHFSDLATGQWEVQFGYWLGHIDNFTIVDYNTLSKLHETAILNELHVPSIARV